MERYNFQSAPCCVFVFAIEGRLENQESLPSFLPLGGCRILSLSVLCALEPLLGDEDGSALGLRVVGITDVDFLLKGTIEVGDGDFS
jgi:hypothetical protein